ncbi:MAG: FAD-dependent oxidoreductase [Jatrophihabitantaceae bacterium]
MAEREDVLVIGAGVVGLTTAVVLAEQGHPVRVRASEPPARTTSMVAGAILGGPVIAEPAEAAAKWDPIEQVTEWHRASLATFVELAADPGTGVRVARGRLANRNDLGALEWARQLPGFRHCAEAERGGFPTAFWMDLPLVDMPRYLGYLTDRLAAAGTTVELGTVTSLAEAAAEAPVVINCTGVGARRLADDPAVFPLRGQHVVVDNPGLDDFFFEQNPGPESVSFFPHGDRVILGGTNGKQDWNLRPDPAQTEAILRRCVAIEPRLAGVRIQAVEVGLRAARARIRLAEQTVDGARVIHNYGHGGIAVGLSWGCARDVARLVAGVVRS